MASRCIVAILCSATFLCRSDDLQCCHQCLWFGIKVATFIDNSGLHDQFFDKLSSAAQGHPKTFRSIHPKQLEFSAIWSLINPWSTSPETIDTADSEMFFFAKSWEDGTQRKPFFVYPANQIITSWQILDEHKPCKNSQVLLCKSPLWPTIPPSAPAKNQSFGMRH